MTSGPRGIGAAAGRLRMPPNYWDPIVYQNEQPTPHCLLRVRRDIAELHTEPLPGVFVAPEESDLTRIHAVLVGPSKTPYHGGFFHFLVKCPPDYPMSPPRVRIMTTDGGRVTFNRHFYSNGKDHLSTLNELLFYAKFELRELPALCGQLELVSLAEKNLYIPLGQEKIFHQAVTLVYQLLKTHPCL
ncbi:ubiquitin-conjugating enzyme E2 Z [Dermacentor silvarum]|uniref:ubiquitin-conjugating enzyme E2 Z n=1 Tax=Dermacentor silvarum TaxID=543639 RepID=UPI001899C8CB|nr:ubiquitin-conjugating enzyme E2 Z [Dermacentor silvarum]